MTTSPVRSRASSWSCTLRAQPAHHPRSCQRRHTQVPLQAGTEVSTPTSSTALPGVPPILPGMGTQVWQLGAPPVLEAAAGRALLSRWSARVAARGAAGTATVPPLSSCCGDTHEACRQFTVCCALAALRVVGTVDSACGPGTDSDQQVVTARSPDGPCCTYHVAPHTRAASPLFAVRKNAARAPPRARVGCWAKARIWGVSLNS